MTVSAGSAADEEKARREAVGVLERVRDEGGPSSAEVEGPAAAGGAAWVVKRGGGLRGNGGGLISDLWPRGAVSVTVSIWISRWVVGDGPVLLQARVRLIGTVVIAL